MNKKVQVWVRADCELKTYILLLKRTAELGGQYQPITGGVEEGEETLQAAKRELFEETGLIDQLVKSINFEFTYERQHSGGRQGVFVESCFLLDLGVVTDLPMIKIDPKEHCQYHWFHENEVEVQLFFLPQKKAFNIVRKFEK